MISMHKKAPYIKRLGKDIVNNWILYVMILPVILYVILFCYVPMYGVTLAFKAYRIKDGILGSPWVGLSYFSQFTRSYSFWNLIRNTLGISLYSLLVDFPLPIVFALMLNYLRLSKLKKTVQLISYAPHFISVVVMCGIIKLFFADNGPLNRLTVMLGGTTVNYLTSPAIYKSLYVWTGAWQGMGWSAIIYISALAGVDYEMHEAAIVDGATKIKRMIHIDLPSIKSTVIMLLIMRIGGLMGVGFDKAYLLQNELNLSSSEVLATYVYKMGLIRSDYSLSTAAGLFNTVINLTLIVTANTVSKKLADESLF
jgi:putative aldouronate transport system permease protein